MTAIGGCGYVNVSWTVIGNNDACLVDRYTIKLLSSTMDELAIFITSQNRRSFSGLPYNTLFYVTVFGHNTIVALSNSVTTSVKTLDLKGIYRYSYIAMYVASYSMTYRCICAYKTGFSGSLTYLHALIMSIVNPKGIANIL